MGLHNTEACPGCHSSHCHTKGTQGQQLLPAYLSLALAEVGGRDQTQFRQEPLEVPAASVDSPAHKPQARLLGLRTCIQKGPHPTASSLSLLVVLFSVSDRLPAPVQFSAHLSLTSSGSCKTTVSYLELNV